MKKRILMLIGALTIISMVFISCSNNKSQTNITDEATAPTIAQTEIAKQMSATIKMAFFLCTLNF